MTAAEKLPCELILSSGHAVLLDPDDYVWASRWSWQAHSSSLKRLGQVYAFRATRKPDGRRSGVFLHRVIMGAGPGQVVDHVSGDTLDCRRAGSCPVDAPLPTISAGGVHVAEVRAFLTAYYGSDATGGQNLRDPLRTITAKHRLGLVTVAGVDFQIVDIGMRMLEPHELLRAQFGDFAERYDLSAAKTKTAQVRLIGNSVLPNVVEALVRANLRLREARAA